MLSDITNQYVEWFSKNTFSAQEVYSFYALYFFLQKSNRYRELAFPEFKELPEHGTATYQIYARIAIYSCHYEELYTFFDSLPEMPTSYYSSLLSYLSIPMVQGKEIFGHESICDKKFLARFLKAL